MERGSGAQLRLGLFFLLSEILMKSDMEAGISVAYMQRICYSEQHGSSASMPPHITQTPLFSAQKAAKHLQLLH